MPTILVADDNSNIQKMVSLALKEEGIEVVAVGNGEAAVRKLSDLQPDLVLADIFMPVRNGYEVCDFVKKDQRFSHIPVILLLGAFDPLDEQEVQRVHADGVLKKPFVPPDPLINMVRSSLEKAAKEHRSPARQQGLSEAPVAAAMEEPPEPHVREIASSMGTEPHEPMPKSEVEELGVQAKHVDFSDRKKRFSFGEFMAPTQPELEISWLEAKAESQEPAPDSPPFPAVEFGSPYVAESLSEKKHAVPTVEVAAPPEPQGSALEDLETGAPPPASVAKPEAAEKWEFGAPPEMSPLVHSFRATSFSPAPQSPAPPSEPFAPPVMQQAPSSSSEGAVSTPPSEPAHVQSFPVSQPVDPAAVDAVVEKVLARLQPQVLELLTREILRPVVEALLQRELEKQQK